MKKLILTAFAAMFAANFAAAPAFAGAQQEKMKTCNKEAGEKKLKGDERKKFMSECLSADKPTDKPADKPEEKGVKATQQEKMKACNKDAGEKKLKGDERKKFMSECLKSPAE